MDFGPSSNPVIATYPPEYSLYILTCPSISAVMSHVSWIIPLLVATARKKSTLVRAPQFCDTRTLERLQMRANRKVGKLLPRILAPSIHGMR